MKVIKKKIIDFLETLSAIGVVGLLIYFLNFTDKGKKTIEFVNFIKSRHGNSILLIIFMTFSISIIFYLRSKMHKLRKDRIKCKKDDNKGYSEFELFLQSCQNLLNDIWIFLKFVVKNPKKGFLAIIMFLLIWVIFSIIGNFFYNIFGPDPYF